MTFEHAPMSFPVSAENAPVRRRAVFSAQMRGLESHHAGDARGDGVRVRRRKQEDDSLRLIDDLTNRPMDPLFSDSRLVPHPTSAVSVWATRIVVFLICIVVGFAGSLFVQQLHTDPRRAVRQELASDLERQTSQLDDLTAEIGDLRGKIEKQSSKLGDVHQSSTLTRDEMGNGTVAVKGEGITLTMADPVASDGATPRESGGQLRVITDADLQQWVSVLWQAGAEAIAVNGYRIGVQTSIRTAGQTILIGVNAIESPYSIQAIGDRKALAAAVGSDAQPELYRSYGQAGIHPQVTQSDAITLEAAVSGDLRYARED